MRTEVAKISDIPDDRGLRVQIDRKFIALFKVEGQVYAINAICPHAGAFLDMGWLDDHTVICPLHGWDFDVRSGESPSFGIKTGCFEVDMQDDAVFVITDDPAPDNPPAEDPPTGS